MAARVPTNEELAQLQADSRFQSESKWAVYKLANYYKNQDGANLAAGPAGAWRKLKTYSLNLLLNPYSAVDAILLQWAIDFAIETGNFQVADSDWDNDPGKLNNIVDQMIASNTFESIANIVFTQKVSILP